MYVSRRRSVAVAGCRRIGGVNTFFNRHRWGIDTVAGALPVLDSSNVYISKDHSLLTSTDSDSYNSSDGD
ncbi:unnamed protein product, partial [Brenthis ino]